MGRIEYWLLGAVGALIAFVAYESLRPSEPRRYAVQIEQAGHVSNLERPAAFNHVLSEFLAALDYA